MTRALGIAPDTLAHAAHAERTTGVDARHMRIALWPATWGYMLEHLVGGLGDETLLPKRALTSSDMSPTPVRCRRCGSGVSRTACCP